MMAALLALAALVLLAAHIATVVLYLRRLRGQARLPGLIGQPPVTLLRPVCGSDPFDAATLGSSFAQDYPDYRIIFCAPSEGDPAAALVRRLIAANPDRPATLLTGQAARSGNPKLDNVWKGWDAAETDWICMTDSNVLLPRDYLATMAASWGPDTALVSSPVIGTQPDGFAGSLECAFLNSNQARLQFAADSLGSGFAQGKTLFWNRPMLEQAGGLPILGRFLAEDVSATKFARGLGRRVSLPPLPAAQPIGRRSLRQVWDRQLRWSRVRRDGFPMLFMGEPANGALVPALIALAAVTAGVSTLLLPAFVALWYGAEVLLMRRAGWPCGGRDIAALPVRDLMIPAIWSATFLRRGFEWRGTAMDVTDADAGPIMTESLP
jgi:ceramide glucosyltransferase